MDRIDKISLAVIVTTVLCGVIFLAYMFVVTNNSITQFAFVTVPANGLTFKNGVIESPALILEVNENDFLTFAKAHSSIVYGYKDRFYTFNENMTVAYRYTPIPWFP